MLDLKKYAEIVHPENLETEIGTASFRSILDYFLNNTTEENPINVEKRSNADNTADIKNVIKCWFSSSLISPFDIKILGYSLIGIEQDLTPTGAELLKFLRELARKLATTFHITNDTDFENKFESAMDYWYYFPLATIDNYDDEEEEEEEI